MKKQVKINHDYFSLTNRCDNIKYFIRQGHIISHLIDRFKWYRCPKYFIIPSFPTHIDIEVSSACQMQCPMCRTTKMIEKGIMSAGYMDMDLYKKIINECARESLYSIKLSWRGEPLLNPNIIDMVSYAKKSGIKDVAFLSNGERLSPKLTEGLVDAGLDWISISFDGMDEIYNNIRKPAIYEESISKIKYIRFYREKLRKEKPLIRIQSVRSAINGRELEFLELWNGIADRVNFIADQKRSLDVKDYRHDPCYICPSPWQRMIIARDGKVTQCCEDYLEENVLGDVKNTSLKEIWHDEPSRKLRELIKKGQRLRTKPCRICSEGGIIEEEEIMLGKRRLKLARYVDQSINVKDLVAKK